MDNLEFVEKIKDVEKNYKTLYVMGCFGSPLNEKNKQRYTQNHAYNKRPARTAMIKAASYDTFGFDCVNLIKGVMWGWNGDLTKKYGGAVYSSNHVPDVSADGMILRCKDVTTDFSSVEVGEALWKSGHIGVYIGDGLAIECTPSWKNKVQITVVQNMGITKGYNARQWTKHGKFPFIHYLKSDSENSQERIYKVCQGDSLWSIASKLLGKGNRYKEIMLLNELSSEKIFVGMVLKIPEK